ncbi:hypothetical protein DNTS_013642 [Danionella cerebrum]|uniref:Lck-interacting transmembrane adapter 1 n=1 Tax=Danionella cerebrum TaxID=2873325 RepID=A0A553RFD1_9TELE|nr:hypothetical protein DNTS_013642 [Danionella translucida]
MSSDLPKVLILGAIAAGSAFVVTVLILLVCVGCQKTGIHSMLLENCICKIVIKSLVVSGKNYRRICADVRSLIHQAALRQSKLNPMSKSDTRLHDMHRLPCNANGAPKSRPASMDLLLLHTRRSNSDLRQSSSRQLPRTNDQPQKEDREHTYSEVGRRASPTSQLQDDGLYESVGIKGVGPEAGPPPPAPPSTSNSTPPQQHNHSPKGNGNGRGGNRAGGMIQEALMAEYATIRKMKKLERGRREEVVEDGEHQSLSSSESSSSTLPRRTVEPFHLPSFPKEALFMGNGEQYIWKPPEEDEVMVPGAASLENGQNRPTAISDMYSTVCKTLKRRHMQAKNQEENRPSTSAAPQEEEKGATCWPAAGTTGEELWGKSGSKEEPCYEPVGEKTWPRGASTESDPAYANIDSHRKREKLASNTLKPKKKLPATQCPGRAMTTENFYETISDVKQGEKPSSTTTIFTFNDGMEMYVTGL